MIAILLTLLVLVLLVFLAMMPGMGRRDEMQVMRVHYAHRGLHGDAIPENSPEAYAAAIRAGYGIEIDVRLTSDGVPVVFHDATLDRVCGVSGTVGAMTLAQLREVTLPNGEHIPTFAELLEQVGGQVPLLVEIKGEDFGCDICAGAAALLDNYDGVFSVQSFNPIYLNWFRQNRPGYIRGLLYTNLFKEKTSHSLFHKVALSNMLLNLIARPDFVAYDRQYPGELPVRVCRDLFGIPCLSWTIRSETEAHRVRPGVALIFEGFTPDR